MERAASSALGTSPAGMVDHAHRHYGMNVADAAEWNERFLADMARHKERRAAANAE
jgi:hypothetical protein